MATAYTDTTTDLFDRFATALDAWHLRVYNRPVPADYPLICDATSYYRVDATLADVRANPEQYTEYMRDWLAIDADEDATAWPECRKCGQPIGSHVATRYGTEWEHMECPKPTYCARIVFYSREGWNLQDIAFTSHADAEEAFASLQCGHPTDTPPNWYAARLELFDGLLHVNFRIQDTIYNGFAS